MHRPNGNAPATNRGVDVQVAEAPNSPILPRIGGSVEVQLDKTLWQLVRGELELHDLTPALQGFWAVAHAEGRRARQSEIDRLVFELDRNYSTRYNPAKVDPKQPSFADLIRLRGYGDEATKKEAERYERFLMALGVAA